MRIKKKLRDEKVELKTNVKHNSKAKVTDELDTSIACIVHELALQKKKMTMWLKKLHFHKK